MYDQAPFSDKHYDLIVKSRALRHISLIWSSFSAIYSNIFKES